MKILLTGSDGYLGALLAPLLIERGHDLMGVDTGFYRRGYLYPATGTQPKTLSTDIRALQAEDLLGYDAVVHMAELSNDPTGALNPTITYDINHHGSVRLARLARAAGVRRFVYMSSCSVYGVADGTDAVTERSPINPQTAYAKCKALCERDIGAMADSGFSPVFLRNATAFGASPRQRFDVVVNNLCGLAWTTGVIRMSSDGSPWRPLVHGLDIAQAVICTLEAPREQVHGEIFNVGSNDQNYRIREVAELVGEAFPDCEISLGDQGADNRSYRVNFDKIRRHLPGFHCQWNVRRGVRQFRNLFDRIGMSAEVFNHPPYTRLRELEELIRHGLIDDQFYWTGDPANQPHVGEADVAPVSLAS